MLRNGLVDEEGSLTLGISKGLNHPNIGIEPNGF